MRREPFQPMIYISQILGGPELQGDVPINRAIAKLYRLRGPTGEGELGSLDVVFHVAGSVLGTEFSGVRTGRFSRKRRMLQVQIAVPKEVVASEDPYPILALECSKQFESPPLFSRRLGFPIRRPNTSRSQRP
jgi:hypothetical protein